MHAYPFERRPYTNAQGFRTFDPICANVIKMSIMVLCGRDLRRRWIVLDVQTVFEDISARSGWHQHALTCYPTYP